MQSPLSEQISGADLPEGPAGLIRRLDTGSAQDSPCRGISTSAAGPTVPLVTARRITRGVDKTLRRISVCADRAMKALLRHQMMPLAV